MPTRSGRFANGDVTKGRSKYSDGKVDNPMNGEDRCRFSSGDVRYLVETKHSAEWRKKRKVRLKEVNKFA